MDIPHRNQMLYSQQVDTSLHNEKLQLLQREPGGLCILEWWKENRVKQNHIIARLEDSDVRASLEQAKANLRLNEADLKDAQQSLLRQKSLLDKGTCESSRNMNGADARFTACYCQH